MTDFDVNLVQDNKLSVIPKQKMLNPTAKNTMRLMVDIYNQTDKILSWKQTSPFFALQNQPKLLEMLVAGKKYTSKVIKFYQALKDKEYDKLAVDSFFGSRTFTYSQAALAKAGIHTTESGELGILSIVDFLNHQVGANRFQTKDSGLYVSGKGQPSNQELFVHYNNFDALLTYLIYGFVDISAPWLFSTPIQIMTSNNLKIDILGNSATISTESYSQSGDYLADYLPNITSVNNKHFGIDKLVIPNKANNTLLRESLNVVIKSIDKTNHFVTDKQLAVEVTLLERQIIAKNLSYWREIGRLNTVNNADVELLTSTTTKHINSYASSLGISMF
jgi:hypothetical protein